MQLPRGFTHDSSSRETARFKAAASVPRHAAQTARSLALGVASSDLSPPTCFA
jgi:hypothetical protein